MAAAHRNGHNRDMARKTPGLSPEQGHDSGQDDAALFREAIGEVRVLPTAPPSPKAKPPAPRVRSRDADEAAALRESRQPDLQALAALMGDTLAYRRDSVSEAMFKRLKRGEYAVADEFDLHGLTVAEAEKHLKAFLHEAVDHRAGCVRIVHGKGLRSEQGIAPLRAMVDRVLRHHGHVLAFSSAPAAQGGTGATLALLRSS